MKPPEYQKRERPAKVETRRLPRARGGPFLGKSVLSPRAVVLEARETDRQGFAKGVIRRPERLCFDPGAQEPKGHRPVDDVLGVNSGTVPQVSGHAGFAGKFSDVTRRVYFDHIELARQT